MVNRRVFLGAALGAVGCGRNLASRYFGWLFVASASEKALAVADLSDFRRVASIPLPSAPTQVFRVGPKVFASCPDARVLCEIDTASLKVVSKIAFPSRIAGAAVRPDGTRIAVLTEAPSVLHVVDPVARRVTARIALPGAGSLLDVTNDLAAVATATGVTRVSLRDGRIPGNTELGFRPGLMRLHDDAKLILIGAADRNQIVTVNSVTGSLLARAPLAFTPARFCFNSDMGQMFVTGSGADELAIFSPYQSEVDQTIVAGRTPYGMAVGAMNGVNLLFITNPGSGDLTMFDIDQRSLVASVHIGGNPGEVLLTPDGEYALVVNQESGDVSVVRVRTVMDKKNKVKPLFTVFAMGSNPQSAAIVPQPGRT
jgi:DNA-binding beta-propeller fold protein YncE